MRADPIRGRDLAALAATLMLAVSPLAPAGAATMTVCTADGPVQLPFGGKPQPDDKACAHACTLRERKRG
jgi:hypothetical protein